MIAKINGVLDAVEGNSLLIRTEGGLTYQVHVPAYTAGRMGASIGQGVGLHTVHYLQSENQGSTFQPRLAGFVHPEDRAFFELFTTCKGIGPRRALRAMAIATAQIAAAIADRDTALLQSLPEIGKRTAETIVATLSGKVEAFLAGPPGAAGRVPSAGASGSDPVRSLAREALDALVNLGENRTQALTWINQVLDADQDRPRDSADLIQRVYRLKAGG